MLEKLLNYLQHLLSSALSMLDVIFTGADAFKDDGVYTRYFTKLKKGKYNLKVRVGNQPGRASQFTPHRYSGALYVPGYIVDGNYCLLLSFIQN